MPALPECRQVAVASALQAQEEAGGRLCLCDFGFWPRACRKARPASRHPKLMATQLKPTDRRVLYLYGVTRSQPAKSVRLMGVDLESPVEAIECEAVICWLSRVSADEFEDSLTKNMENLDWLASASVAHQRAVGGIAQHADILPARFGTVFRDENSLRAHIRQHLRGMERNFLRVKDAEEWGIKIFAIAPVAASGPKARTGREYLQAKAAQLPRKKPAGIPEPELTEFQSAIQGIAEASAPPGRISGGQRGLLFQTSLLVKRNNLSRLESVLRKFSRKWASSRRIEKSGPWPPYSFVSQDPDSL